MVLQCPRQHRLRHRHRRLQPLMLSRASAVAWAAACQVRWAAGWAAVWAAGWAAVWVASLVLQCPRQHQLRHRHRRLQPLMLSLASAAAWPPPCQVRWAAGLAAVWAAMVQLRRHRLPQFRRLLLSIPSARRLVRGLMITRLRRPRAWRRELWPIPSRVEVRQLHLRTTRSCDVHAMRVCVNTAALRSQAARGGGTFPGKCSIRGPRRIHVALRLRRGCG